MKKIVIVSGILLLLLSHINLQAQPSIDTTRLDTAIASLKKQVAVISDSAKATKARLDSMSSRIAADSAAKARKCLRYVADDRGTGL